MESIRKIVTLLAESILSEVEQILDYPSHCQDPDCKESLDDVFLAPDCPKCCGNIESSHLIERAMDRAFNETVFGSEYWIYDKYQDFRDEIEEGVRQRIPELRS